MEARNENTFNLSLTVLAAAVSVLAGCGSDNSTSGSVAAPSVSIKGVVTSSSFVPGSATDPTIIAGYYQGALVCVDGNNNGKCDSSENPVTTDSKGNFTLSVAIAAPIIADIGTTAINTATGTKVASRLVLRASIDQENDQTSGVIVSPLSSEVARSVEANGTTYATEKANLAARMGVPDSVRMQIQLF